MSDIGDNDNNNIAVDTIMEKVRANVKKRKGEAIEPENGPSIDSRLQALNTMWNVGNYTYTITSHRKILGPVLVSGRRAVQGEVTRYVDPIVQKQNAFNENMAAVLLDIYDRLGQHIDENEKQVTELNSKLIAERNLRKDTVEELKKEMESHIELVHTELKAEIDYDIKNMALIARLLTGSESPTAGIEDAKGMDNVEYLAFENRFRGSVKDIKQRQAAFIEFFSSCSCVVDIGCGRGEFLELMRENGIGAIGIDLDYGMVRYCLLKKLNVQKSDALKFIESREDGSIDGIFIDQVVEHLEPGYLVRLLAACSKKLKEGCHIVVETVNPLSLLSFINFYIDMSHVRPVHPSTLEFLLESVGFSGVKMNFISPAPDYIRLEELNSTSDADRTLVDAYNRNVEKLNNILYGAQDYYVVAKK